MSDKTFTVLPGGKPPKRRPFRAKVQKPLTLAQKIAHLRKLNPVSAVFAENLVDELIDHAGTRKA